MSKLTPGMISDQESEAARQRAAGRQKQIKKANDPSNAMRGSAQVSKYKADTKENWRRAAQESRMNAEARAYAIQQARKKAGGK